MYSITNHAQLETWLAENGWFADGYVAELYPRARPGDVTTARIRLGRQVQGTYRAGQPERRHEFVLHAVGVVSWTYDEDAAHLPEHCMEGVELLNVDRGLGIQFDAPGRIALICRELHVDGPFVIDTTTKPRVSDRDFFAHVAHMPVPLPQDWITWLAEEGLEGTWRSYGGEAKAPENVPYPDYAGWFLQERERVPDTRGGVFFRQIAVREQRLALHLEKWERDADTLWLTLTRLAAGLAGAEIRSGNCTFTGQQWLRYLQDGSLPVQLGGEAGI